MHKRYECISVTNFIKNLVRDNYKGLPIFVFVNIFIWILPSVYCQTPALKEFNLSDGLPSSNIYQTIQDKDGFIWIATDKGVSKYNGYSFENFTVKDGLPSNDVWGLIEDLQGRIWLNTVNKLSYIENDKIFTIESDGINLSGAYLNHIVSGDIHLVKISLPFDQLYLITEDLKLSVPIKPGFWGHIINHIFLFDSNKNLVKQNHVLTSQWQIVDNQQILKNIVQSNIAKYCKTVLINENQIIFNYQDSILRFKNGVLDRLDANIEQIRNQKKVCIQNTNLYLLESSDYTYWLDEDLNVIPDLLLEPNLNINTASIDRQDNLWISTTDGLFLLNKKAFESKSYTFIDRKPLELYSIKQDKLDRIWMGGNNSLFYLFKNNGKHKQYRASDIYKKPIKGIDFDHNEGMLLSGFYNYYYPKNIYNSFGKSIVPKNDFVIKLPRSSTNVDNAMVNTKCILMKQNSFLISTDKTLSELNYSNNRIDFLNVKTIKKTYALGINSKNDLCLGQSGGVSFLKNNQIVKPEIDHPVFNLPITDLKFDTQDHLWIATQGNGLFRYANNQIDTIYELLDQNVNNIKLYNDDDLWVSNSSGIHQMKILSERPLRYSYKKYDRSFGMISNEPNDYIISDSLIYAATKRGLSVIKINFENEKIDSNLLLFSGVSINDRDTLLLDNYDLAFNKNNIQIDFVWLTFLEDQNAIYSYMLEGEDADWKTTKNIYKEYSNLSPGKYQFKVKVKDISHKQISSEKTITFNIHKPWWLTKLSILIFAFLFCFALFSIYSLLIQRAKKQAEQKNLLNMKFAELELNALQAQMNPHFIFNALNSIQDFIFNKDNRTANKYLVKFSKLMRLFLESSKEKDILFSEELQLIRLYVELEELRFGDKFSSFFIIDESIDQNKIRIPSMIIQPFVENAINHGLKYKETGGQLKISFQNKKDIIHCTVEDNGVGRAQAKKLNQQNKKSHRSRGWLIVNERKNILNLMMQSSIEIKYIDITDKSNNALGTKVEIRLPY